MKNLPAKQELQVQTLSREDPLEEEMATHSSILAWEIPWTEESGGVYSPLGPKRVGYGLVTKTIITTHTIIYGVKYIHANNACLL